MSLWGGHTRLEVVHGSAPLMLHELGSRPNVLKTQCNYNDGITQQVQRRPPLVFFSIELR